MHYLLMVIAAIALAFGLPGHVAVLSGLGCLLVAASVKLIAGRIAGAKVGLFDSLSAVILATFLLLVAVLFLIGGMKHLSVAVLMALNPWCIPLLLFAAYVLGFQLCLGTTFMASAIIAVLSTLASVGVIGVLKAVA